MKPPMTTTSTMDSTMMPSSEETMETDETYPCGCLIKEWGPVCGTNGQTYTDECSAKCVKSVMF